ncbi:MAG: hypothetical protein KDA17_02195 [Candidatus Saccharibacteria bacterium]|nr:hypothetical protein [Candidatus Saccharibacteria bacterium]
MMIIDKLKINTELIASLKPCSHRFDNWRIHYDNFNGTIIDFLELENITAEDKIWVSVRVLPRELVEVFAIDCAFSASATASAASAASAAADTAAAYAASAASAAADTAAADTAAAAAYAAYATYAAADTAAAAYAADTAAAERENQVDALIMLIKGWKS